MEWTEQEKEQLNTIVEYYVFYAGKTPIKDGEEMQIITDIKDKLKINYTQRLVQLKDKKLLLDYNKFLKECVSRSTEINKDTIREYLKGSYYHEPI